MKKHLKSLLVFMLVVPCLVLFSACGGVGKPANGDWFLNAESAESSCDSIFVPVRTYYEMHLGLTGVLSDEEVLEILQGNEYFSEIIDFANITTIDEFWAALRAMMVAEIRNTPVFTISGGNTMTAIIDVSDIFATEPDYQQFTSTFSISSKGIITIDNADFIAVLELEDTTIKYQNKKITITKTSGIITTTTVIEQRA